MKEKLKNARADMSIIAVICIIIGVILFIWPVESSAIFIKIIGVIMVIAGAVLIISYLLAEKNAWKLLSGVVLCGLGIWIAIAPVSVIVMISIVFGILLLVHGIQDLTLAMDLKRRGYQNSMVSFLLAAITIVLALILIFNSVFAWELGVRIVAICLIYDGVSDIFLTASLGRGGRKSTDGPIDVEYKER